MWVATSTSRGSPCDGTPDTTPKTASDLECPHGVQFYDVARDGTRSARAAWSSRRRREKMKPVDHWIGFWEDVKVE